MSSDPQPQPEPAPVSRSRPEPAPVVPAGRRLVRDAVALAAAMVAVGASFGAIAIAYGLPAWVPFLMSTAVFAGGAQFLAAGLLAAGNPIAAVLAGLLLNARHLPFGLAVSETLGPRLRDRLAGSHLMTDEVVAFTLAESDPARRRRTYWLIGVTLFTSWNLGTALGVVVGAAAGDPSRLGLDAAFPAALIALLLPSLRDRETRTVALSGAAVAVLLTPVLPAGLPVLCALAGLFTLFRPRRRHSPTPPPEDPRNAAGSSPGESPAGAAEPFPAGLPRPGAEQFPATSPGHSAQSVRGGGSGAAEPPAGSDPGRVDPDRKDAAW